MKNLESEQNVHQFADVFCKFFYLNIYIYILHSQRQISLMFWLKISQYCYSQWSGDTWGPFY